MLHTGAKPYHPANRRVRLSVAARDLQARYGLSDDALQFVCQVRTRPPVFLLVCLSVAARGLHACYVPCEDAL
jgi:hypothetical protein